MMYNNLSLEELTNGSACQKLDYSKISVLFRETKHFTHQNEILSVLGETGLHSGTECLKDGNRKRERWLKYWRADKFFT